MAAIEVVSGFTTAAGATPTQVTYSSGTGTIRNFSIGRAFLLQAWRTGNTSAGYMRVRSPRLHDAVQGIRLQNISANNAPLMCAGAPQILTAQDTLTVENSGSAVAGDIENVNLLVYYENLDGANGRYIDIKELSSRIVNVFTVTHALVGAVTGAYGAAQTLAAGTGDLMKANTDYALLGATCSESAAGNGSTIRITGSDLGNVPVGIPVIPSAGSDVSANWFYYLSHNTGVPTIPVVNAANKGGTLLDVLNNENANTVTVSTIWAQLR